MLYFSLFSGELFDSEEQLHDPHQIPLAVRPSTSCRKCHGRFYTDYNLTTKQFNICPKCLAKCLDVVYVTKYFEERNAKKKN